MLAEERQLMILKTLAVDHVVKLKELVSMLNASESTVRRDLQELESRHLLRRVHGGASLLRKVNDELDMESKTLKNVQQKKAVARLAATKIKDNDCIFLDAGTTTLEMIHFITAKNVTVVTNGPAHVDLLVRKKIICYLLGGQMKSTTKAVIGSLALQAINLFRFDTAFIGVNGIDPSMGYTTPDPEEAALKRRAHDLAQRTYIVSDSSKFSEISFCKIFDLAEAIIITDHLPDLDGFKVTEKTEIYVADQEAADR
ncbi:DeoR/GlpR family DNA-binding transcription regulator [Sporolactobacillus inulinus]|uniref:DeoR faimly transcriptional regulator n=1 Tax=Sporolactobacillus inulinus CASD TaxID=1069536 RepID=A0A0U1QS93_9BACL|nr:DeoR/GlpR family DNA-binding transcription regulator [Sporolactobacillus inulinus]KLI03677.1 DeoR faimly transcriptional regulator [Sporolactobacillus inulinus CASD]GEB75994.1 DeoR family transcriptional regulator [Sporolactobacillus inulinus]